MLSERHRVILVYNALHKAAEGAGVSVPTRITTTTLRKYMATMSQVGVFTKSVFAHSIITLCKSMRTLIGHFTVFFSGVRS